MCVDQLSARTSLFFFQAEDGIRYPLVTGVQTCALPILYGRFSDDLQDSQRRARQTDPTVGVQRYEIALELTYRFRFRGDALFFQPDLQYIIRPGGTGRIADAFVAGFQAGINF